MRFLHYDVFTNKRFEGNQLAVFTNAGGLTSQQMQTLAQEMNFSESTFILPREAAGTDIRMRIFTPGAELPMAGHPTIGSTFALAHEGTIAAGLERWVFGLNIGPTPVELAWNDGRLSFAWMDQRPPEYRDPVAPRADIIRAAGLDPAAVDATKLPIEEISCGVSFTFIPVQTRAAVDAAEPDIALMRRLKTAFPGGHNAIFMFSTEPIDPAVTAYSRMFAPSLGVSEDPATGGASGPLACYLVKHGLVRSEQLQNLVSEQGVAMGRPSRIHMRIGRNAGGEITRVQVGGQAVRVGEGTIEI